MRINNISIKLIAVSMVLGMTFGIAVSTVFGALSNNIQQFIIYGISFGSLIGVVVGTLMAVVLNKLLKGKYSI